MTNSITQLIAMPEDKTLEFKRDISAPMNILKILVAFASTAGGRLLIGIEDDSREVLGVGDPLDEEERMCNLIADSIEPRLAPNVGMISSEDKTLLKVEVYPSELRLHWLRKEGPYEGVYVRLGSTNRNADRDLIQELMDYDEVLHNKSLEYIDIDDGVEVNYAKFEGLVGKV